MPHTFPDGLHNRADVLSGLATGKKKARARAIGIPFEGSPGELNAITDVEGVEVGHTTLIRGEGPLKRGMGPVRTGVSAILPRGRRRGEPTFAAWFSLNGRGEMTGTTWVEESGMLEGPVMLTNTLSVGVVRDAVVAWKMIRGPETIFPWTKPVVAETWDGYLNDIFGFHVKQEHVFDALENARPGPVPEGNVGGGTGMICHEFKGGIGTSSRKLTEEQGGYTVGILVQANYGRRDQLRIAGVPVGLEIEEDTIRSKPESSSIIVVAATDAPLLPHQLKRVARRIGMGIARNGGTSENGSGDIFIAFSTANAQAGSQSKKIDVTMIPNTSMNPIFDATIQATEEAIINALIAAETMTGIDNHVVVSIPQERLQQILKKSNRLAHESSTRKHGCQRASAH